MCTPITLDVGPNLMVVLLQVLTLVAAIYGVRVSLATKTDLKPITLLAKNGGPLAPHQGS